MELEKEAYLHTLQILEMAEDHKDEAARIISTAALSNPISVSLWGGQSEAHRRRMEHMYRHVNLAQPKARGLIAKLGGEYVAACNWVPWPHCQLGLRETLHAIPYILTYLRGATWRAMQLYTQWAKYDPPRPHWHLDLIGVLPAYQGSGLARALITHLCDVLDAAGACAYFETAYPWFLRVHQAQGFTLLGEIDILGVHNYFMWREPGISAKKHANTESQSGALHFGL